MKEFSRYVVVVLGWLLFSPAFGQDNGVKPPPELIKAIEVRDFDAILKLTTGKESAAKWKSIRGSAFQQRGVGRFFEADIKGSISDFDGYLKLFPEQDPDHWQRGLAYYYAGEYEKGVAQFERHQTVNSHDVENAVWHFLCVVRAPGGNFKAAQKLLIPITGDSRVPMKEVHELFAGRGSVEDVLKAATPVPKEGELSDRDRNNLCYAHLYLALYFEALGTPEKVTEHIRLAAGKYRMEHYMGKTAQVHAKLRGVTFPKK